MLLVHSSASYPAAHLFSVKNEFDIRSIGLFNACGHERVKAMKPAYFADGTAKIYMNDFGRTLFQRIGPLAFRLAGHNLTVTTENLDEIMTSAVIMYHSGYQNVINYNSLLIINIYFILFQTEHLFKQMKNSAIPLLFVFSENDALVSKKEFFEFSKLLGGNELNTSVYDKEGNLIRSGK